jgi:hypothetical protein
VKITTTSHLNFEITKVKAAIKTKDSKRLESLFKSYHDALSVPVKDLYHSEFITLASKHISFHLLSIYHLLNLIDEYWDGYEFTTKPPENPNLFHKELFYAHKEAEGELEDYIDLIERSTRLIKRKTYVFLYPFEPKEGERYVIHDMLPFSILLIYADTKKRMGESIIEGLAHYYTKTILAGKLPIWAKTEEEIVAQYKLWSQRMPSKFD